jgi:hypothetical protein
VTEETIHCRTFLGHVLSIGDTVLGLDLRNSNVNNPELEKLSVDKVGYWQCCGSVSGSTGSTCFWASRIRIY